MICSFLPLVTSEILFKIVSIHRRSYDFVTECLGSVEIHCNSRYKVERIYYCMYSINYRAVTRTFGKLAYYDIKRHLKDSNPAGVRNPFVLFGYDIIAFSSAHSRTFCATRMVGRPVKTTVINTSLLISLKKVLLFSSTTPLNISCPNIPSRPAFHYPPSYTYTVHTSFIPQIYLHCPHIINHPHIPTLPIYH